jgi:hypothetical protein
MGRDPNYLPESVCSSFELDLDALMCALAEDGTFKEHYQLSVYRSKYIDEQLCSADERRHAAIQKWLHAEYTNLKSNERIPFGQSFSWCHSDDIRAKARLIIGDILGSFSDADNLCVSAHTNGASTRIRRTELGAILKHSGKAHCSSRAMPHWSEGVKDTLLRDQEVELCDYSELFTVPKATDIDRVACKEPEINLFLQRGVGDYIRKRLRRIGIDLNDQSRNQELARLGVERGLATIDLSSASDSISQAVVFDLLPFEWWSYLDDIRSRSILIDGQIRSLEMFSSMGNGFTFELESLIFYALTRAVCWQSGTKGVISVYGDDIVAPSSIVPRLRTIFAWYGFTVNLAKSFWTGDFRESCGKHYHKGRDVTPFYIRGKVSTKTDMIRLLNRLIEWDGREWGFVCDPRVANFLAWWSNHIPQHLWGGQDVNDISSLVTGHPPRKRLVRKTRDLHSEGLRVLGADYEYYRLLRWYTLKELSSEDPVEVVPARSGSYFVANQPSWIVRTHWKPFLAFNPNDLN